MKKNPSAKYERKTGRKPYIGTMACDSRMRKKIYIDYGCNAFTLKRPKSMPLSFWLEEDIWEYIRKFNIPYSKIYDMGEGRTGCVFCAFGVHMENGLNRFQRMKQTHPKQWNYCINKLGMKEVFDFMGVKYE